MEQGRHRYRICCLDYVWYVAEQWSDRMHNNLKGDAMLQGCWCIVVLVPVLLPLLSRLSWVVALVAGVVLAVFPLVWCQFRYTAGRREALRARYRDLKHPGRKLGGIILLAIALGVANLAWMASLGFIHFA